MGKTVKCNSRSSDSITKACYVITIVSLFQINNFIICDSIFEERQKYTGSVPRGNRVVKKTQNYSLLGKVTISSEGILGAARLFCWECFSFITRFTKSLKLSFDMSSGSTSSP